MIRGDRIKKLRESKHMTQSDLGDLINVTKVSVCGYEKGTRTPNLDTLSDICEVLETTPSYIMGIEVDVIADSDNNYGVKLSTDEIELIKELRKNREVYNKFINDPKRIIELLKIKLK